MKKHRTLVLLILSYVLSGNASADEIKREKLPYSPFLTPNTLTVLATFDGSYNLKRWQELLDFSEQQQIPFTIFVSGVFYLPNEQKMQYQVPPELKARGKSSIGFGGSAMEVDQRKKITTVAAGKGVDIESHLNGHFNGADWATSAWNAEFNQFDKFCNFLSPVHFVRFPYLAMNDAVYKALRTHHGRGIVSVISSHPEMFNRVTLEGGGDNSTFLEFPIDYVKKQDTYVPSMDYCFFEVDQRLHLSSAAASADMVKIYLEQADRCFREQRPFILTHHFTKMNHGAYWEAEKQVLLELKKKYAVEFLTVNQLSERIVTKLKSPETSRAIAVLPPPSSPYPGIPEQFLPDDYDLLSSFWPPNIVLGFEGKVEGHGLMRATLHRTHRQMTAVLTERGKNLKVTLSGTVDIQGHFVLKDGQRIILKGVFLAPDRISGTWTESSTSTHVTFRRLLNFNNSDAF